MTETSGDAGGTLAASALALRRALTQAGRGLVERETLVELIALCAVAGEHLLVIGPPGTAKSEAVRRVARATGATYFEYLLGRFTEPSEIFGPVDLRRLREGVVETETAGMLPEAEIAFLDEVFLGSTAILNTLLGLLNERTFRRGHTRRACPLRLCVGASNALPDDEALAAFADRFLLRTFLSPIADPRIEELLEGGWALSKRGGAAASGDGTASLAHLDRLAAACDEAELSAVRPRLAHAVRLLRGAGVPVSDRRAVKLQRLVAAAAVLDGRTQAGEADLWPIVYAVPTAEAQQLAREVLRDLLRPSKSEGLPAAAEEASHGPLARATRIAAAATALLDTPPPAPSAPASEGEAATDSGEVDARAMWRLRIEGIAREIDAGFAPAALPPALSSVRARLVEALGRGEPGTGAAG